MKPLVYEYSAEPLVMDDGRGCGWGSPCIARALADVGVCENSPALHSQRVL